MTLVRRGIRISLPDIFEQISLPGSQDSHEILMPMSLWLYRIDIGVPVYSRHSAISEAVVWYGNGFERDLTAGDLFSRALSSIVSYVQ